MRKYFSSSIALIILIISEFSYSQNKTEIEQVVKKDPYYTKATQRDIDLDTEYIRKDPTNNAHYLSRALKKETMKDYRGAFVDLNTSIHLLKFGLVYKVRGRVRHKLKDYHGAIYDYNNALQNYYDNQDAETLCLRGISKVQIKDNAGAMADFNKAININPYYDEPYFERGLLKSRLEDYRGAIADFDRAINFQNDREDYFFVRGIAKLILKQTNSGCLDLSRAGELGYSGAYEAIKKYCR